MARKPMVTRTITTTEATVLCVDIEKGEPFNTTVVLPRTYKDEKSLMKATESAVNNGSVKAVHVVATKEVETLYGMEEAEFIKYAVILPPRKGAEDAEA